jgi:tetratricopeptide (TPR) repeat protein
MVERPVAFQRPVNSRGAIHMGVLEFLAFSALFLAVHALVLVFVFPGYYDPFWPHHSDTYIAVALAYSPDGFLPIISWHRPIGYAFFWLIGHLHTRGVILASLLLVAANYAVILMTMRRAFQISLFAPLIVVAAVFAYLLAVHPFQYVFSTYDVFAQLSLLLLLVATAMYFGGRTWWKIALVTFLAFMAKETYIASASFLAGIWFLWHIKKEWRSAVTPMAIILGTFALAIALNRIGGSVFVGGEDGSPYQIALQPKSVITEWFAYSRAGVNALGLAVIATTAITSAIALGYRSAATVSAIVLPVAGSLSWLPNAILPNHHFDGYSWNGAYLLYAPIVLLAAASLKGAIGKALAAVIAIAAIYSPALSTASFANNGWVLMNQKRQKMLMRTLDELVQQLPKNGGSVLVSGISFPFSPFDHWPAIFSMNPPAGTRFYVVAYKKETFSPSTAHGLPEAREAVKLVAPDRISEFRYDQAWLIKSDGSLIENVKNPSVAKSWTDGPITSVDVIRYPELRDNFGPDNKAVAAGKGEGYRYLECGAALLAYNQPKSAETCLRESIALIPDNPYPYFYLGNALKWQGRVAEAREAYSSAVKHEGNSPNPAFSQALSSLK